MVGPVLGGFYQHYKGGRYKVLSLVKHSETLETLVYYQCLYDNPEGDLWVRPLAMFMETVVIEGKEVPRFRYMGDSVEESLKK